MSIRTVSNAERLRLTVTLRDGTVIGPCDTTERPFGDNERFVAIFRGDLVSMYPMDLVARIDMDFDG